MSGFFGCVSRKDCVADVFTAQTTILIWERNVRDLLFITGRNLIVPSIVWRVPISGINLNRNWIVLPGLTWGSG